MQITSEKRGISESETQKTVKNNMDVENKMTTKNTPFLSK